MKLSVIIPVYNEERTLLKLLDKVKRVPIEKEIIIIDDASTDSSSSILEKMEDNSIKVIRHQRNMGKGSSFIDGLNAATGDVVVIQDADLEYDPDDLSLLFEEIRKDQADLVLGARFLKGYHGMFFHRLGNRLLTIYINLLFKSKLNDYATCYKMARTDVFRSMNLKGSRFDIDSEIICLAQKKGLRVKQIPVKYFPRNYSEGKKIRWHDGLNAIVHITRLRHLK